MERPHDLVPVRLVATGACAVLTPGAPYHAPSPALAVEACFGYRRLLGVDADMRPSQRARSLGMLVLVASTAWALPAGAQPRAPTSPSAQADRERARALGEEGLEHFAAGRWQEAHDRFERADRLFHAPTLTLYMARCQAKLGRPLAARALYERLLAEPVPPSAPKPFLEAQASARTELAEVEARVGRLTVVVTGGDAAVAIDGVAVEGADRARRPVEPGEHTIEVTSPGQAPVRRTVTVAEGAEETVSISVSPAAAPPPPPPHEVEEGSMVPALVAFGVGAAGLGVGSVTGILALSKASELKDQCDGNRCAAALETDRDAVDTLSTLSTIGFVVGGVGVATGVVLLVVRPGGEDAETTAWRATVGPGRFDVRGAF